MTLAISPAPLAEWMVGGRDGHWNCLSWSPAGYLAVVCRKIVTIFRANEGAVTPITAIDPLSSDITSIAWCQGVNESGYTPLQLLVATVSGRIAIINGEDGSVAAKCKIGNGSRVVKSVWSPNFANRFFTADDRGNVTCYEEKGDVISVLWSLSVDLDVEFMAISPFKYDLMVVASDKGKFRFVDCAEGKLTRTKGHFPVSDSKRLISCKFYPFLDRTLLFVYDDQIYIYRIPEDALIRIFECDASQESIRGIEYDLGDETLFFVIYESVVCEYIVTEEGFVKRNHVPVLSYPDYAGVSIHGHAMSGSKLALLTRGNVIQLLEFRNRVPYVSSVYHPIFDNLTDYDVRNMRVVVGTENGYLMTTLDGKMKQCFRLFEGKITRVKWLNDDVCVVVGIGDCGTPKAFHVNLRTAQTTCLLRANTEVMAKDGIDVIISPNGKYYVLVIAKMAMFVYNDVDNFATILEPDSICATFCDWNGDELWCVTQDWRAKRYTLTPTSETERFMCRSVAIISPIPKGVPVVCASVTGLMLCGTDLGSVIIVDWHSDFTTTIGIGKLITSITARGNRCFVNFDDDRVCMLESNEDLEIKKRDISKSVDRVRWITDSEVLVQFTGRCSLTTVRLDTFDPVVIHRGMRNSEQAELMESLRNVTDIEHAANIMLTGGYYHLSELVKSLLPNYYSQYSYGTNFSQQRMKLHLQIINGMFSRSHKNVLRVKKAQLETLLGNYQRSVDLLCETSPECTSFAVDVMKAALVRCDDHDCSLAPAIGAFVIAGKMSEAVDLLIFSNQYREATRVLVEVEDIEWAMFIAKSKLTLEEYSGILGSAAKNLVDNNQPLKAAALLLAHRKYEEATRILNEQHRFFATVIASIKCD